VSGEPEPLLDQYTIRALQVPPHFIERETQRQQEEMRRRLEFYREGRPPPDIRDRTVIVVDDGIATGYTIRAAVAGLRKQGPARVVVAVPVAPSSACDALREEADHVVCLRTPEPFIAVGAWYVSFDQTTDAEVVSLLRGTPA
jgi:predicted phosphoribosyltransferase